MQTNVDIFMIYCIIINTFSQTALQNTETDVTDMQTRDDVV